MKREMVLEEKLELGICVIQDCDKSAEYLCWCSKHWKQIEERNRLSTDENPLTEKRQVWQKCFQCDKWILTNEGFIDLITNTFWCKECWKQFHKPQSP